MGKGRGYVSREDYYDYESELYDPYESEWRLDMLSLLSEPAIYIEIIPKHEYDNGLPYDAVVLPMRGFPDSLIDIIDVSTEWDPPDVYVKIGSNINKEGDYKYDPETEYWLEVSREGREVEIERKAAEVILMEPEPPVEAVSLDTIQEPVAEEPRPEVSIPEAPVPSVEHVFDEAERELPMPSVPASPRDVYDVDIDTEHKRATVTVESGTRPIEIPQERFTVTKSGEIWRMKKSRGKRVRVETVRMIGEPRQRKDGSIWYPTRNKRTGRRVWKKLV